MLANQQANVSWMLLMFTFLEIMSTSIKIFQGRLRLFAYSLFIVVWLRCARSVGYGKLYNIAVEYFNFETMVLEVQIA